MEKFYYLIHIQFLGFRYSGWQKQKNAKTVQGMLDKTFQCIFNHENFKTLGAGRTDAKVSAQNFPLVLTIYEKKEEEQILKFLNENLPPDIQALRVVEVDQAFNVINDAKVKEYHYYFTNQQMHPFCSPFLVRFPGHLDIELMQRGARLFEGEHNFQKYCYKPSQETEFSRIILSSEIIPNTMQQGTFFPDRSFLYRVRGKGFLRHQIRLMMGTLIELGRGEISLVDIENSLEGGDNEHLGSIAPSSGLSLFDVEFTNR